jgi:hypothetical protein
MPRRPAIPLSIELWSPKLAVAWLRSNGYKEEALRVEEEFIASGALPAKSH